MTNEAGSGHPTSCLSSAEIITSLFFKEMKYDITDPFNSDNDEFILSKGHAAPILYSALYRAGASKESLHNLRKFGSSYEGHSMPSSFKWAKVATGSLGQGLSVGVGIALAAKMQKKNFRTYVLMGDSECVEGSIYEALQLAAYNNLGNLCAIVDVNRLGQSGETMLGHDVSSYKKRFEGFGWNVLVVNGHDLNALLSSFSKARQQSKKPTIIIAKTLKGKGISFLENKENWHGKALNKEQLELALKEIPDSEMPEIKISKPNKSGIKLKESDKDIEINYNPEDKIATREAYGSALAKLGKINDLIVVTDGETKNSTHAEDFLKVKPNRYVEAFIAEQNMVGMALGLSVKGFIPFASTFACFLSRAHDQIRMAALSNPNLTICGSHCGISIGQDGASQMGLEDISMFRALPNSIVFYPSDAVSTEKIVQLCSREKGLKYIRTTREKTSVIYKNDEDFKIGDFKVIKSSKKDKCVLVGAGITLHECLKAAKELDINNKYVCVVDLYCVKPFNASKFIDLVKHSGKNVVVVEDHYSEGGIGEMISGILVDQDVKFRHLCVKKIPHSGPSNELLDKFEINSKAIIKAVKELL